jgi:hypothetical protein
VLQANLSGLGCPFCGLTTLSPLTAELQWDSAVQPLESVLRTVTTSSITTKMTAARRRLQLLSLVSGGSSYLRLFKSPLSYLRFSEALYRGIRAGRVSVNEAFGVPKPKSSSISLCTDGDLQVVSRLDQRSTVPNSRNRIQRGRLVPPW